MTSAQFKSKYLDKKTNYNDGNDKNVLLQQPRNKYGNRVVQWSGIWRGNKVDLVFHSQKECNRGVELIALEKSGRIRELDFQKTFVLIPKFRDERRAVYKCDAYYFDIELDKWVVEDTKSPVTRKLATYNLKKKLLKWKYRDIEFKEV